MKRGLWICLILVLLFAIPGVFAEVCSDPGQIILKIEYTTNAHGELWGEGNYGYEICYDSIFGVAGNGDRTCSGDNVVLRLSGDTNAQAESPSGDTGGYQDVCYGTLSCVERQIACQTGETEVLRLSAGTNAHIEEAGGNNYDTVICCNPDAQIVPECSDGVDNDGDNLIDYPADPGCESPEDNDERDESAVILGVEWRNLAGNKIGGNGEVNSSVNSTVRLFADTTFPINTQLTFDIYERDSLNDDDILLDQVVSIAGNGEASFDWKITDDVIEACGVNRLLDDDYGEDDCEFYFTARVDDEKMSDDLIVINDGDNEPPIARIVSPVHRGIYFANTPVLFNHTSFDPEGNIVSFKWTILKNGVFEFDSEEEFFYHTFADAAQRTITLRIEDDKGESDEDQIAIIVTDSPGILAYIAAPEHHQVLVDEDLSFTYDGGDSYVMNSVFDGPGECDYTITCLAGFCPSETENTPPDCLLETLPLTGNLDIGFDSFVTFDWTFKDSELEKNFEGDVSGLEVFGIPSNSLNDKLIELVFGYDDGNIELSVPADREFTLVDGRQCVNNGNTWLELDENGFIIDEHDTSNSDACKGLDGIIGSGDDCCPALQKCTADGCRGDEGSDIDSCRDYSTQNECELDEYGIGRLPEPVDPLWDEIGCGEKNEKGRTVQCECAWGEDDEGDDICSLEATEIPPPGNNDELCSDNMCFYFYEEGECVNGFMELIVDTTYTDGTCPGDGDRQACEDEAGVYVVPCGRPTIELPFFGRLQFLASILVIIAVYVLIKVYWRKKD